MNKIKNKSSANVVSIRVKSDSKAKAVLILNTVNKKKLGRKDLLRQKYIELRGEISKDEFIGFMMKPDFLEFVKESNLPAVSL